MVVGFHPWVYVQLELRETPSLAVACEAVLRRLGTIVRDVAQAGFEGFESMANLLETDEAVALHRQALRKQPIELLGASHNAPFWDPAQREQQVAYLEHICRQMAPLGGRHLGLSCVPPPAGRAKTAADWDAQAETLRAVARMARRHGITPNLHTYAPDAADDYCEVRETLSRLQPDELAFGPDLAWLAWGGGDPLEVIRRWGDRITLCHLRNRRAAQEWSEGLDEGIDDQAKIGAALLAAGFDGAAVFEPAFPDDAPTRPLTETWAASARHAFDCLRGAA